MSGPRLRDTDRRIVGLALPALGTLAVEPLYRLVDTAIIGRLGTDELGGLAVAVAVLSLVIAGSNFLAYGTTEQVARHLGARRPEAAARVGVQAMWLSIAVSAVAVPALILLAEPLAVVLGADDEILGHAVEYLRISAFGVPFVLIALAAQGVQRGAADYRTPLVILLASNLLNLVLELIFVLGFDLGIAGAAWSTVIAQVGAGMAFLVVIRDRIAPAVSRRIDRAVMGPLATAGRHLLVRVGSMLVVFTGSTAVAARIDDPTLAAHQVCIALFFFAALTLDALAVPAQTLVADELGRGDRSAARDLGRRVVVLSLAAAAGIAVLLAASAPLLARAFSRDPAVISRATVGMLLLAVLLLPGAVAFAYDGVFIGAADYRFLGRAAFGYLLAVIPIAVLVLAFPGLGIVGIWIGLTFWMVIRAFVNSRRFDTLFPIDSVRAQA
ncbi:MAG: MATE family efflux transporter [Acidimicrobiia bacterium]|nr:MATE family efflux transporter [Acidimicrobiia bacterium]